MFRQEMFTKGQMVKSLYYQLMKPQTLAISDLKFNINVPSVYSLNPANVQVFT